MLRTIFGFGWHSIPLWEDSVNSSTASSLISPQQSFHELIRFLVTTAAKPSVASNVLSDASKCLVIFIYFVLINWPLPRIGEVLRKFILWNIAWFDLPPDAKRDLVGAVQLVHLACPRLSSEPHQFWSPPAGIQRNTSYFYRQWLRNKPLCRRGFCIIILCIVAVLHRLDRVGVRNQNELNIISTPANCIAREIGLCIQ